MARCWIFGLAVAAIALGAARTAAADDAVVTIDAPLGSRDVGRADDGRFSLPPRDAPIAREDDTPGPELRRSPVRLVVGPAAVTSGHGLGTGVEVAAAFGTGTLGGRISAAWIRGEGHATDPAYVLGDGIGQYAGELSLDLHKRGPWHPVVGIGVGLAHLSRANGSGTAGIGTGRIGVEYALPIDDEDVRVGLHATGVLTGPEDDEIKDARGWVTAAATVSIGF